MSSKRKQMEVNLFKLILDVKSHIEFVKDSKSLSQIHLKVKLPISVRSDFDLERTTSTNIHILSVEHSLNDVA
jgi:hypothetical protein